MSDRTLTAPVFNIQPFSIHDGPGIRTTVFLKGCPLRCIWCANPESNLAKPQLLTYANKCTGCGRCVPACPKGAVSIAEEKAVTDRKKCVDCGACVSKCPSDARELAGKEMSVEQVLAKVLEDRLFLEESGGGMTVSGGECLMHPDFTEALLKAAKEEGISTAVESSCFASEEVIRRVFRYVDTPLLDIKHMDDAKHREFTGVPNEQILRNIKIIKQELGKPVVIRIPTIPGCNDSEENIAATAKFVAEELGTDVPVHLLPYHRLGEVKKESLGEAVEFTAEVPENDHMERRKAIMESFGLNCQIGG